MSASLIQKVYKAKTKEKHIDVWGDSILQNLFM